MNVISRQNRLGRGVRHGRDGEGILCRSCNPLRSIFGIGGSPLRNSHYYINNTTSIGSDPSDLDPSDLLSIVRSGLAQEFLSKPELIVLSVSFAVAYEVGSLIDRFGSFLESIFKKASLIPFEDDYILYNKAIAKCPVMSILQKGYAVSRTQFTLFIIFAVIALFASNWQLGAAFTVIGVVQYFSWRKFAGKIVKLMNAEK